MRAVCNGRNAGQDARQDRTLNKKAIKEAMDLSYGFDFLRTYTLWTKVPLFLSIWQFGT